MWTDPKGGSGEPPSSARDLGFRAAAEVVERFISSMATTEPRNENRSEGPPAASQRAAFRQLRADLARAVDANLDLVRRAFDLYAGAVDRLLGNESSNVDGDGSHLKLPPVIPGHRASSTIWVHNTTSAETAGLAVRASDLVSSTGQIIRADAFEFEPAEVDIAPPNSSLAVGVSLTIDPDVVPGWYRGYLFVSSLPAEFMTIAVEVVGPVGVNQEDGWRQRRQAS
jgi:hypothetical protein